MAKMGNYCKAYPVSRFRAFDAWPDQSEDAGLQIERIDGAEAGERAASDYMFLQEDFTVTKGVFMDEDIVFDKVTPEWVEFCKRDLQFEIPDFASAVKAEAAKN